MTEYDYSPEAFFRFKEKQQSIAHWAKDESWYINPLVPSAVPSRSTSPYSSPSYTPFEPELKPFTPSLPVRSRTVPPNSISPASTTYSLSPSHKQRKSSTCSQIERRLKKGDEDYVKRPENAFILFRRHCCEERQAAADEADGPAKKQRQADLSKTISQQWKGLSADERQVWEDRAKEKKKEHEQLHSNNAYRPQHSKEKKSTSNESSDSYYGHEDVAKLCARFITDLFSCPDVPPPSSSPTPNPTLAHFVAYALHRTRLSSKVTFAGLALLQRLKARFPAARGSNGHRLFISAFMIASKVICDDTYSNKSWAIVSQEMFSYKEICQMEREMCSYLEWQLSISPSALDEFEQMVRRDFAPPNRYMTFVRKTLSKYASAFSQGREEGRTSDGGYVVHDPQENEHMSAHLGLEELNNLVASTYDKNKSMQDARQVDARGSTFNDFKGGQHNSIQVVINNFSTSESEPCGTSTSPTTLNPFANPFKPLFDYGGKLISRTTILVLRSLQSSATSLGLSDLIDGITNDYTLKTTSYRRSFFCDPQPSQSVPQDSCPPCVRVRC